MSVPGADARWQPRARKALVLATYLAITTWWLWPLPLHLADHATFPRSEMPEVAADYHLIVWALAWDTHALLTEPARLFDANIFHPAPKALAFSEHFLGYVPLFAPTYLATGNPVLAANLMLFATYPLCALAMAALARRFVSAPAAFLGGALFAFCGLRYESLYHFHQLGTFWLPLALLFADRWLERARTRSAVALSLALALQLLSSYYLAYALAALLAGFLPLALWRWRGALDRRRIVGLAAAIVAGVLPALLASLPYLEMQRLGLVPASRGDGVVLPFTMDPRLTMVQIQRYLTAGGIGIVGYLLALLALVAGWRRATYPRVLGLATVSIGVLLASGPRVFILRRELWSPYSLLSRLVPGFAAIRLPARFLVLAQLGGALLAALGMERVLGWLPRRLAWPATVVTTALALVVLAPPRAGHTLHPVVSGGDAPPVYHWLAEHGRSGALLELPSGDPATAARRMVLGSAHWLPMIDGYSAYPPLSRNLLRRTAIPLPDERALQELVDLVDVRWIVVHLDELEAPARRAWEKARVPGLKRAERFGDDLLFAVERPVVNDLRGRLVSTEVSLNGVPLVPVGQDCRGQLHVRLLDERPVLPASTPVRLGVQIDNTSPVSWPGFGFYPRQLVQLRSTFLRDGAREGRPAVQPLWADVPHGESVVVTTEVTMPAREGSYELEIGLEQDGASLARCGLAPVRLPVRVGARRPASAATVR